LFAAAAFKREEPKPKLKTGGVIIHHLIDLQKILTPPHMKNENVTESNESGHHDSLSDALYTKTVEKLSIQAILVVFQILHMIFIFFFQAGLIKLGMQWVKADKNPSSGIAETTTSDASQYLLKYFYYNMGMRIVIYYTKAMPEFPERIVMKLGLLLNMLDSMTSVITFSVCSLAVCSVFYTNLRFLATFLLFIFCTYGNMFDLDMEPTEIKLTKADVELYQKMANGLTLNCTAELEKNSIVFTPKKSTIKTPISVASTVETPVADLPKNYAKDICLVASKSVSFFILPKPIAKRIAIKDVKEPLLKKRESQNDLKSQKNHLVAKTKNPLKKTVSTETLKSSEVDLLINQSITKVFKLEPVLEITKERDTDQDSIISNTTDSTCIDQQKEDITDYIDDHHSTTNQDGIGQHSVKEPITISYQEKETLKYLQNLYAKKVSLKEEMIKGNFTGFEAEESELAELEESKNYLLMILKVERDFHQTLINEINK
jgi:hypothetical protein